MELYYSPLACSLAAHIAWREAGLDVSMVRVELSTKRTERGGDLLALNAMGQVPTLTLGDGQTLTENAAVLSYLADLAPDRGLKPDPGSPAHYELTRWLSFVGNEIHKKVLYPIFAGSAPELVKEYARSCAPRPLGVLADHLKARDTLLGESFSIADAYLFWGLMLMPHAGIPLDAYPALRAYFKRHVARPSVAAALAFEREQYQRPFSS